MLSEGRVGALLSDADRPIRLARDGAAIVTQAHGQYYEAARQGQLFAISTPLAGSTLVAGNVSPVGAAAISFLTLYNIPGSGVNLKIIRAILGSISGTPGAGAWGYNVAFAQAITAAQNAAPVNTLTGAGSGRSRGFTQTALTGSTLQALLRAMAYHQFAGAIAATTPGLYAIEDVQGSIVVPPGGVLSLAAPAVGTTHIVYGALEYEEAPV